MGERQRVMIARALSTRPRLLLADEPTGSLDSHRAREVLELLRELCREREVATMIVSHDPMTAAYADRVLALRDGRLSEYVGDPAYSHADRLRRAGPGPALTARLAMKPLNALHLYRVRLRARWMQESLAAVGIAAGVALLFASEVSSSSLQSSVSQLSHGIAGRATLQLLARSPQGMPESLLARVRAIGGVRVAAPVLESGANAIGAKARSASVQLIGADASLARLGGALVRHTALRPFAGVGAVVLPAP